MYPRLLWYWNPLIIIIGVIIGWFLNIIIYRYPRGESLLYLPYCPNCKYNFSLKENIPIVSFFLLKGNCPSCEKPFSVRYPIVEIITGILLFIFYRTFGFHYSFYFTVLFFIDLILIGFIDLENKKIPLSLIHI